MGIGQRFNTLTLKKYFFYMDNHKKYKDFNRLGLYRSILKNEKLSLDDKLAVRDYTHKFFKKSFDFLQLKDSQTFMTVDYLGQELAKADEHKNWEKVRRNQQRILKDKKIKHRNFGDYSKHNCGYDDCSWNGLMIRQGSWFAENSMHFDGDINRYQQQDKSDRRKSDRKKEKQIVKRELENE